MSPIFSRRSSTFPNANTAFCSHVASCCIRRISRRFCRSSESWLTSPPFDCVRWLDPILPPSSPEGPGSGASGHSRAPLPGPPLLLVPYHRQHHLEPNPSVKSMRYRGRQEYGLPGSHRVRLSADSNLRLAVQDQDKSLVRRRVLGQSLTLGECEQGHVPTLSPQDLPAHDGARLVRNHIGEWHLSLIHISEPTRRTPISYAVFC